MIHFYDSEIANPYRKPLLISPSVYFQTAENYSCSNKKKSVSFDRDNNVLYSAVMLQCYLSAVPLLYQSIAE